MINDKSPTFCTPRRALMNDPMFDWSRPRTMRRRLVVGLGALIVASGSWRRR